MGHQPNEDPRILEAIEACRPHSDDLEDPGLAFLADQLTASPELQSRLKRVQQLDTTFAEVIRDVPVPSGLAERIMARVAADCRPEAAPTAASRQVLEAEAPAVSAAIPSPRREVSRRWLFAGAGSLAALAVSVLLVLLVWDPAERVLEPPDVLKGAVALFDGDSDRVGRPVAESPPPRGYPPGPDFRVSTFPEMRWRWVDFLGYRAVAYDVRASAGRRATLYVVKCAVAGLPAIPPPTPQFSRDRATAAWQSGELLYVLVVEGPRGTYEGLLRPKTWT